jgi:hypothetical protein
VWVFGAEVSADWKTNLGIIHPQKYLYLWAVWISFQAVRSVQWTL